MGEDAEECAQRREPADPVERGVAMLAGNVDAVQALQAIPLHTT
jgi:hypothetical protein